MSKKKFSQTITIAPKRYIHDPEVVRDYLKKLFPGTKGGPDGDWDCEVGLGNFLTVKCLSSVEGPILDADIYN